MPLVREQPGRVLAATCLALCLLLPGVAVPEASPGPVTTAGTTAAEPGWGYSRLDDSVLAEVATTLTSMKGRERGPYRQLRWFCADGTVLPPQPYACREHGGGLQHGQYTEEADRLHELGFHVGPILAAIDWDTFFDLPNSHYYLRELVLQRFLERADNGWVMRRARFYRGARQAENEEAVGRGFLEQLLSDGTWVRSNYLLASSAAATVPHGTPGVAGEAVRGLALQISDADPGFMRLRVKIHSSPSADDLEAVTAYRRALPADASYELAEQLGELEVALRQMYSTGLDRDSWERIATATGGDFAPRLRETPDALASAASQDIRLARLAKLAGDLRRAIEAAADRGRGKEALGLFDALHFAQGRLFVEANAWADQLDGTATRRQLLDAAGLLATAAYGAGWITAREHDAATQRLAATASVDTLTRAEYLGLARYLGRTVEWGAAAAKQMVAVVVERYAGAEPMAMGFDDDAVRGSVLLPLAAVLNTLEGDATGAAGLRYQIGDAMVPTGMMGLNSGVAVGQLYVISDPASIRDLDPEGIYVLPETPADLGRVAGILTVDQGSRLSHVQLLARGLGVPNAAVSSRHLGVLGELAGTEVLYAVSPLGSVLIAPLASLSEASVARFRSEATATAPRVTIDTTTMDLTLRRVLPLEAIEAADSGRIAGPKAANLGQLHQLFPDRVAPGLVVPFGVFRAHVDRDLDGDGRTLYEETAEIYRRGGDRASTLRELEAVAGKIRSMPLIPSFEREFLALLRARFELRDAGGVFVRSDTNVEDLPGFSGAGLNLTVMNVIGEKQILQAIRDVWASPYRTRSYDWRSRVITNPEAVYPSILVLGSVPVEASGVLVTRDVDGALAGRTDLGPDAGWTATVAAGVGGAVDGEAAETLLLPAQAGTFDPLLLSSARAAWRKALGEGGGMRDLPAFGDDALLTPARIADLTEVINQIRARYPQRPGAPTPWDVEFGFLGDDTVLFQIRPFIIGAGAPLPELQAMDAQAMAGSEQPVTLSGDAR